MWRLRLAIRLLEALTMREQARLAALDAQANAILAP